MSNHSNYHQYEVKEGIIILIEVNDPIFNPVESLNNTSQLHEILKCINDLISDMVVTFPSNGVGIYLYQTEKTASKYPKNSHMSKIFSLNDLNSSNMKILMNIVADSSSNRKPLSSVFSPVSTPKDNLHTVLKIILREFHLKPQYNRKKLLWFTNNPRPYSEPLMKESLRTMINDFDDNNIVISPIFLETSDSFDCSLYEEIFLNTNFIKRQEQLLFTEKQQNQWTKATVSSQLRDSIFRLKEVKRVQFACDLILSDGVKVGGNLGCSIKGYSLYGHERIKPFRHVWNEGDSLKLIFTDSLLHRKDKPGDPLTDEEKATMMKGIVLSEAEGKVLPLKEEVWEYIRGCGFDHTRKYGETNIEADIDEEEDTKEVFGFSKAPYLKLLCFRRLDAFQPYFNLKPPVFVTADLSSPLDSARPGGFTESLNTFRHLYQSCVRLERYAVVFGCIKGNSNPSLFALYPTNCGNRSSNIPDGFLLFGLPWLSEIRSLPDYMLKPEAKYFHSTEESPQVQDLVEIYKLMVSDFYGNLDHGRGKWETEVKDENLKEKKVKDEKTGQVQIDKGWNPYTVGKYSNPVIQYFYQTVKKEALQMDIEEDDDSLLANDWSSEKLVEIRKKVLENLELQELISFANVRVREIDNQDSIKRTNMANELPQKRQKSEILSEAMVISLWKNDSWNNVTVSQLRQFMTKYDKIKRATKKSEMVENIIEFLNLRTKGSSDSNELE